MKRLVRWCVRIIVVGATAASVLCLTLWLLFRPQPVPAQPDWVSQWNALTPNHDEADARDIYIEAIAAYNAILASDQVVLPPHVSEDDRTWFVREAVELLAHGRWGHPAHQYGTEYIAEFGPAIELLHAATATPYLSWHIDGDKLSDANSVDELHLAMLLGHEPRLRIIPVYLLSASLRMNIHDGSDTAAVSDFEAILSLAAHVESSPSLLNRLVGASIRSVGITRLARMAIDGECSPALLRSCVDILKNTSVPPPWSKQIEKSERIFSDSVIWDTHHTAQSASYADILLSFIESMRDEHEDETTPLWKRRRWKYDELARNSDVWQQQTEREFTTPLEELPSLPAYPKLHPVPDGYLDLTETNVSRSIRKSLARYEILNQAALVVLQIELHRAETGRLPDSLDELGATSLPHAQQPLEFNLIDEPPGYTLIIPDTPLLRFLSPPEGSYAGPFAGENVAVGMDPLEDDAYSLQLVGP